MPRLLSAPKRPVNATDEERSRALPGDEYIPDPLGSLTHAVTIHRRAQDIWPWLAQMGAGSRGGWYSYDFLDNGRRPSADHIVPELQQLTAGMVFPALPGAKDGFTLLAYQRNHFLVLGWRLPDRTMVVTWSFVLEPRDDGTTRLITRARGSQAYRFRRLPSSLSVHLVRFVHFVMQRKELLGIAARAEALG